MKTQVGGKVITIEKARRGDSLDMVFYEMDQGRKYLLFLGRDSIRKMMEVMEDLVMDKLSPKYFWNFEEPGRELSMEVVSNRSGKSIMIKSTTKNEKRWRRRIYIPFGTHGEGWLSVVRNTRTLLATTKKQRSVTQDLSGQERQTSQPQEQSGWLKIGALQAHSNRFGEWEFAVVSK